MLYSYLRLGLPNGIASRKNYLWKTYLTLVNILLQFPAKGSHFFVTSLRAAENVTQSFTQYTHSCRAKCLHILIRLYNAIQGDASCEAEMYREVRDSWKCARYVLSRWHNIKRNDDKRKVTRDPIILCADELIEYVFWSIEIAQSNFLISQ
jgi:hypothetical protein